MKTRLEEDLIGEKEVDCDAYYGIQSLRAKDNFNITGVSLASFSTFIVSLVKVKKAVCLANFELDILSLEKKDAICSACDEIISGKFHDQFIVDMIQGGAGTSTNMNVNEVIANRALELMGHKKGEYQYMHPNNDVNLSQSTNDAYPTGLRVALYAKINDLIDSMKILQNSFYKKAIEFKDVIKMGRTQLQDAVPMTLGQEFHTYAVMMEEDIKRLLGAQISLQEINLGGTAIGTGINAPKKFLDIIEAKLQEVTNEPFVLAKDLVEATQDTGAYMRISGVFKRVATKISKICNDLRLLSSGPVAGFNEINLPGIQAGSSIMPGKINPVIPEVVNQVAFQVMGSDLTITLASAGGQLQLNVFEPVIAYNLFISINMMKAAFESLASKCVDGITANKEHCHNLVISSIGLVTALNPYIGYEKASMVAKEAMRTKKTISQIVLEKKILSEEELKEILKPENMIRSNVIAKIE